MVLRNRFLLGPSLLAILLLSGCQSKDKELTIADETRDQNPPDARQDLPLETNYQLKCGAGEECDRGIGHIHVQDSNQRPVKRCTGFLISPDTVATTASCLESTPDNCKGKVFIVFEKAGELKIERCQSIINRSDDFQDTAHPSPNFAFFKLDKEVTYKKPIPLSLERTGEVGSPSKYVKAVTITSKGSTYLINSGFCEWLNFSAFMPNLNAQKFPFLPLSGCEFSPEAEGGVILNESFYATAIIAPHPSPLAYDIFDQIVHTAPLSKNFILATHSHCTQEGNEFCHSNTSDEERRAVLQFKSIDYVTSTINKESFKPWAEKNGQYFQWKLATILTPHTKDHYFFPLPSCVKKPKDWPKELTDADIFMAGKNIKVKLELPIWKVEPWINELSLLSSKTFLANKRNEQDQITFNIRLLRWAQSTTLSIDLAPPYLAIGTEIIMNLFQGDVPRCN